MHPHLKNSAAFIAALSAWGPLAFDADAFDCFRSDWSVMAPIDPKPHELGEWVATLALADALQLSGQTNFNVQAVGDTGINGTGYLRVAAIGGRTLPKGQKVAIIPIMGPITPFPVPKWYAEFGIKVAALPNILAAAHAAANDQEVGRIVYAIHSPGGSAFGVGEAAAALREVSKVKPTVAAVTYMCASAGYWLASAQREIVAAPSSMIGSVGVRITHVEVSKALEMEGVAISELSIPESKSDISPYKPLSDTARAEYMALIRDSYATFAADISTARRIDMGKMADQYGRVHPASVAKSIGLIDRVATFEALLGETATPPDLTATRRARIAIMQRERN